MNLIPEKTSMRRGLIVGVVVLVAGGGVWWIRVVQHNRYVASLSNDPRQAFTAMQEGKISDDEFHKSMEPRVQMWQERVDHYFEIPVGPQRVKYLDGMIDEMEQRRAEMKKERAKAGNPATQPANGPATRPAMADRQQRMASRMQSMPPQKRAQMAEFVAAVMKRRAERGLSTDFGPGRGFMPPPGGGRPG